ncbi:MAG: hypothetical protein MI975_15795 [Cytophagales bacterium]|nr:hypothetical protein [Cytophagales bacterium]
MDNIIPLTSIDHIFTGAGAYPIEFVFVYKDRIDEKKLRSSLEETLTYFPPAQSTLKRDSHENYVFVSTENNYSLEVVEHPVNFDDTEKRDIFIDPVKTLEDEILTKVRLTHTPNGSVLGVSISHAVADGFSYFFFLSNWARVFHGLNIFPPSHERDLLIKPDKNQSEISAGQLLNDAGLFLDKKRKEILRDKLIWETLYLTNKELKHLLAEAQKDCQVRLSFNDIIVATLWQRYVEQWNSKHEDHSTYISCPYDYRRMLFKLPNTYFGNAVALATTSLSYTKLMESKLSDLALLVRKNIASVDQEYIFKGLNTLAGLREQKGIEINEQIHVVNPEDGLLVTNLSRLPINQIEFGAGPPVKYEILTPANRGAVILPDENGVQVRVCCPVD